MSEAERDCGSEASGETIQGHPAEAVETGEKIMQSPMTDTLYRVTRWVEKGDDRVVAIDKEPLECGYCESEDAVEWSDQGKPQCATCSPTTEAQR